LSGHVETFYRYYYHVFAHRSCYLHYWSIWMQINGVVTLNAFEGLFLTAFINGCE
jgi:hypothetical protein